jgi:hypothetical protein
MLGLQMPGISAILLLKISISPLRNNSCIAVSFERNIFGQEKTVFQFYKKNSDPIWA